MSGIIKAVSERVAVMSGIIDALSERIAGMSGIRELGCPVLCVISSSDGFYTQSRQNPMAQTAIWPAATAQSVMKTR
ncbi:hypothetical protein ABID49_000578 [Bhargavaea ullalensis]|uniref:Uncharacterized protein n=1 Tax=Bhargavaea ullalensis TaxID=1265685 RepID=A0ABV2G8T7_9BACL